jgi:ribonuclease R
MTTEQLFMAIRERLDHPATLKEIQKVLQVPDRTRAAFRRQIKALVDRGDLIKTGRNCYGVSDQVNFVVGRVQVHPRGFAFVVPERPLSAFDFDVYVSGVNLGQAMHGDRVVTRIERYKEGGRAEGRILRVLDRKAKKLVGKYEVDPSGFCYVVPFDRRFILNIEIPQGKNGGAVSGDMVIVTLTRWPTSARGPLGSIVRVLGPIDKSGVDTELIIQKYGIPDLHSKAAVAEARKFGDSVRKRDFKARTDFRHHTTVTIDGEHARDFDDAITIERLKDGHYWLGVHIADVAHYVQPDSALDVEAYERGTSVYFPERAVHMFPSELSTGLCSLKPGVDRLVQSCLMEVDLEGNVARYEFHDGIINSDARMTYTDVNAILADRDPMVMGRYRDLIQKFVLMHELFEILNDRRQNRGSIDFDLKAPKLIFDDDGAVESIVAVERNVAHRVIEEFMLLANETVAGHLKKSTMPALYRVHEKPDPVKIEEFEEFILTLGYSLSVPADTVQPQHFQELTSRIRGKPEEKSIALLLLRTMQKARYDPVNLGHFGLATSNYTHFTSPIRRYPDLVVHRVLRMYRQGSIESESFEEFQKKLSETSSHVSEMERRADEAERELMQVKKVRFMKDKVGDEFDGYVTGVSSFGLFIELVEHFVEGLVHVSTMADDYYRFLDRSHMLRGENTSRVYRLGDKVRVRVIRVDLDRHQVDLGLVEVLEAMRQKERSQVSRRKSRLKRKTVLGVKRQARRRSHR